MYQQVVARRYAKGFMLSVPRAEREGVLAELKEIANLLKDEQGDLFKLLADPAFSPLEKKAVFSRIADTFKMSDTLKNFLLLLVEKNRATLLSLIYESLQDQVDEQNGVTRAKVYSASSLDVDQVSKIKEALMKISGKSVTMSTEVEPWLLGGIKVDMSGVIFDGTVKAKLDQMKNQLLNQMGSVKL